MLRLRVLVAAQIVVLLPVCLLVLDTDTSLFTGAGYGYHSVYCCLIPVLRTHRGQDSTHHV